MTLGKCEAMLELVVLSKVLRSTLWLAGEAGDVIEVKRTRRQSILAFG